MPDCKSGTHNWIDPISAERCCDPNYKRVLRTVSDPPFSDEVPGGQRMTAVPGMLAVWILVDSEEQVDAS